jgi:hypothetical protein
MPFLLVKIDPASEVSPYLAGLLFFCEILINNVNTY